MKILFITSGDRKKASSRLRVYNLVPYLEEFGHSCHVLSYPDIKKPFQRKIQKIRLLTKLATVSNIYDVIYVQKVCFQPTFTRLLSKIAKNLVYDFDDAIYTSPPWREANSKEIGDFNTIINKSELVIAGSTELSNYASEYNKNVRVLSTGIPQQKYKKERKEPTINNNLLLGWVGNPENLRYLSDIEESLGKLLQTNDSLRLRIITSKDPPIKPFENLEGDSVEYIEWQLESAIEDLAATDVGIRPLRDDDWTKAKGGFTSIIECLALGIPVVANPVGMVPDIIQHGQNGHLVSADSDWEDIITRLVTNKDCFPQMSQNAFESVSKMNFWSEDKAKELDEILRYHLK